MSLDLRLQALWYGDSPWRWPWYVLLVPLSAVFAMLAGLRRLAFATGLLRSVRVACPVLVVGNLSVGGTGKTPLVIWLASTLRARGVRVVVITRGYGGTAAQWPQRVDAASDPLRVGDESVLIARQSGCPVVAGPDRVASAQQATEQGAEVIISDDGLQHYRLQRDGEWVVVDASRQFGNGLLLPAGPLREPMSRLRHAGCVIWNRRAGAPVPAQHTADPSFELRLTGLRSLTTGEVRPLDELRGQRVHVVTAIGHPQGFIAALEQQGLQVDARVLPDHAVITAADVQFDDSLPVLMTGKDAVKCRAFAAGQHWEVTVEVCVTDVDRRRLLQHVDQVLQRSRHA